MVGPISNSYLEVVYNAVRPPAQPETRLPAEPVVDLGEQAGSSGAGAAVDTGAVHFPDFNLEGSSFRHGAFKRNPANASEIGARFHGVTPFGLEFTANYCTVGTADGCQQHARVNFKSIGGRAVWAGDEPAPVRRVPHRTGRTTTCCGSHSRADRVPVHQYLRRDRKLLREATSPRRSSGSNGVQHPRAGADDGPGGPQTAAGQLFQPAGCK